MRIQSEKYVLIQNETFQYQQEIERLSQKLKIKNIEMDDLAFKLQQVSDKQNINNSYHSLYQNVLKELETQRGFL